MSKEKDEIARQLKESNSRNGLLRDEVREANKKLSAQERIIADHKLQAKEWATVRSQHTSQVETMRE